VQPFLKSGTFERGSSSRFGTRLMEPIILWDV
jgi:hypothetical protein